MSNWSPLLWVTLGVLAVVFAAWLMSVAVRWAKKGTKAGSMLAAAAFPFPDQPPPHEQLQDALRLDKDADSGAPK